MSKTITTTTATPIRIDAEHYQIESQTRAGKIYDLFFNRETRRWECKCPDANPAKGNNPNCKHVRRLRAWIHAQMNSSQAQREASEIVHRAPLAALPLSSIIEEKIEGLELAMAQQAEMIVALQELVSILQSQQCKTNEHRFQLDDKVKALQAEVERLQIAKSDKRAKKTEQIQEASTPEEAEADADRKAWEEFEKDPVAGRARQAEKIRAAALGRGNEGFSILKK